MPAGRPSKFTEQIADEICERIAAGESLRAICRENGMPAASTVFKWLSENKSFSDQYARAREKQADTFADEIVRIADTATDANIARLQIDARKWVAGKLRPKVYGDKQQLEHTGSDGTPLNIAVQFLTPPERIEA